MSFIDLPNAGPIYTGRVDARAAIRLISPTVATQTNEIGFYGRSSIAQSATNPGQNGSIVVTHEEGPVNNSATMTFNLNNNSVNTQMFKLDPIANAATFYLPTINTPATSSIIASTSLTLSGASTNLVMVAGGASITGANQTVKFSVKNATNTSIFVVDTTNAAAAIYGANAASKFTVYDSGLFPVFNVDTINKRIQLGKSGEAWTINLFGNQGFTAGLLLTTDANGNIVQSAGGSTGESFTNAILTTPTLAGASANSLVQTNGSGVLYTSNTLAQPFVINGANNVNKFQVQNSLGQSIFNINTGTNVITTPGSIQSGIITSFGEVPDGTHVGLRVENTNTAASQNQAGIRLTGNNGTDTHVINIASNERGCFIDNPIVAETTADEVDSNNLIISNLGSSAGSSVSITGYVGEQLRGTIKWGVTGDFTIEPTNDLVLTGPNIATLGALTRVANGVINVMSISQTATNNALVQRSGSGGIAVNGVTATAITGSSLTVAADAGGPGGYLGVTINNTAVNNSFASLRFISNGTEQTIGSNGTSITSSAYIVAPYFWAQQNTPNATALGLRLSNTGVSSSVFLAMETPVDIGRIICNGTVFDFDKTVRVSRSLPESITQMIIQNTATTDNIASAELQMEAPGEFTPFATIAGKLNYSYRGFSVNRPFIPATTGSISLGTTARRWNDFYCNVVNAAQASTIESAATDGEFIALTLNNINVVSNASTTTLQMQAAGQNSPHAAVTGKINYSWQGFSVDRSLIPSTSGSISLGSGTNRWGTFFCVAVNSSDVIGSSKSVNGDFIGLSVSNTNSISNGATATIEMQAAGQNPPYSTQRGLITYSWKGFTFDRTVSISRSANNAAVSLVVENLAVSNNTATSELQMRAAGQDPPHTTVTGKIGFSFLGFSTDMDFFPLVDNTRKIGRIASRWSHVYCTVFDATATSYISTSTTNSEFVGLVIRNTTGISSASTSAIQMQAAGSPDPSTTLTGKITYSHRGFLFSKNILPSNDNSIDLGASDIRWRDIYTHDLSVLGNLYIDDAAASSLLQTTSGKIVTASNTLPANCSATTMSLISPVLSSPTKYIQYTSLRTRYRTGGTPTTNAGICLSAFDESHFLLTNSSTVLNVIFTNTNTSTPLMPTDTGYGTSGAVPVMNIVSDGRLRIGSVGSFDNPSYSFIAHPGVGMWCNAANDLRFSTEANTRIRLTTSNTIFYNNIIPDVGSGPYNLGESNNRWGNLYVDNLNFNVLNAADKFTITKNVATADFLAFEVRNSNVGPSSPSVTIRMIAPANSVPYTATPGNIKYSSIGFAFDKRVLSSNESDLGALNNPWGVVTSRAMYLVNNNPLQSFILAYDEFDNVQFQVANTGDVYTQGHILPINDNTKNIGSGLKRWNSIYATNNTINTSDARSKTNVVTLSSNEGLDFINNLRPVSFNRTDLEPTKKHFGIIAQELEETLALHGINNFSGLHVPTQPDEQYGVAYTTLIAPMIKAIQELSARLLALESA